MATTILPPVQPIDPNLTVQQVQDSVYNWFQSAIGDRDHASDADDATWYDGEGAGYDNVLMLLEGLIEPFTELPGIVKPAVESLKPKKSLGLLSAIAITYYVLADVHRKD